MKLFQLFLRKRSDTSCEQISLSKLGSIRLDKEETKKMVTTIPRSSIIGFIVGVLPGTVRLLLLFYYGMERNFVKDEEKQKFGKGSVNGLSAPETANNAAAPVLLFLC